MPTKHRIVPDTFLLLLIHSACKHAFKRANKDNCYFFLINPVLSVPCVPSSFLPSVRSFINQFLLSFVHSLCLLFSFTFLYSSFLLYSVLATLLNSQLIFLSVFLSFTDISFFYRLLIFSVFHYFFVWISSIFPSIYLLCILSFIPSTFLSFLFSSKSLNVLLMRIDNNREVRVSTVASVPARALRGLHLLPT